MPADVSQALAAAFDAYVAAVRKVVQEVLAAA